MLAGMISRLRLLRNIGSFDSVADGANIPLAPLTLVYAENGRGKTTLAAVLRSLATGDPIPIAERRRLAALHPPHAVLDCDGGPPAAATFQDNAWNRRLPNMVVFDDTFVDQNVYSGLVVGAEHRQRLHELILGAHAVALNQQLQQVVERIEVHNRDLRSKAAAIPAVPEDMSVDDFCALPARVHIDEAIRATERNLAAARAQDAVRNTQPFNALLLPAFEIAEVERLLQEDLPALQAAAAARLQAHVATAGPGGEAWIAEGMGRVAASAPNCPFCAQDLTGSPVIAHYEAYFSEDYTDLKGRISRARADLHNTHGGDSPAAFERSVRVAVERRQFWAQFCDVPEVVVDTAAVVRAWQAAREAVAAVLVAKLAAPLERTRLAPPAHAAITAYEARRAAVAALDEALKRADEAIQLVKEQAKEGNPAAIASDLLRLNAVRARRTPAVSPLCDAYLAERVAKLITELERDAAQAALELYKTNVFPGYQTAVNLYLQKFYAGFRLDSVTSTNTRGGPACSYNVLINDTAVAVGGGTPAAGEPSFRTALSAGDRNTLALAFFFASLDQRGGLEDHVVVIDDPVSSLDEHRELTTVQEMRHLAGRAGQLIVLSHSKPFLCRLWEGADRTSRAALEASRDGVGSTLRPWDVNQDCVTEHDRRHAALRQYLVASTPDDRAVAAALRPVLEAFVRVSYPEHFPPGATLGPFRTLCQERIGTPEEILDAEDTRELRELVEYANRFHHDTNGAYETVRINDAELKGFVDRTLAFTRR
jgi:wobble nucleotide-excising tRNase